MTTPLTSDLLSIYLRDHRAGSTAGLRLARRAAKSNQDGPFGPPLSELADEIESDLGVLDEVMTVVGVSPSPVKHLGAIVGEFLARSKLNGRVRSYSPLSRVIELEGLATGIEGKRSLWASLAAVGSPALAIFDFGDLGERAEAQKHEVQRLHAQAAEIAFQPRRDSSSGRSSESQNERNPS